MFIHSYRIRFTYFDPISIRFSSFPHLSILVSLVNEKFDLLPSAPPPRNVGIVEWFTVKNEA